VFKKLQDFLNPEHATCKKLRKRMACSGQNEGKMAQGIIKKAIFHLHFVLTFKPQASRANIRWSSCCWPEQIS